MNEGNLGIAIGMNVQSICQSLEENNDDAKQRISEFTAGVSFLIRQDLPLIVVLLYLAEYAKNVKNGVD